MHTHTCTHTLTLIHTLTHMHTHIYTHTHAHASTHTHTHTTHTHIHNTTHTHTQHTRTHTFTTQHIHNTTQHNTTHTHIHVHTHIHIQPDSSPGNHYVMWSIRHIKLCSLVLASPRSLLTPVSKASTIKHPTSTAMPAFVFCSLFSSTSSWHVYSETCIYPLQIIYLALFFMLLYFITVLRSISCLTTEAERDPILDIYIF